MSDQETPDIPERPKVVAIGSARGHKPTPPPPEVPRKEGLAVVGNIKEGQKLLDQLQNNIDSGSDLLKETGVSLQDIFDANARTVYQRYRAFVNAGFEGAQAFQLLQANLKEEADVRMEQIKANVQVQLMRLASQPYSPTDTPEAS